MKAIGTSQDKRVECIYNSDISNDTVVLNLPPDTCTPCTIKVNRFEIQGIVQALQNIDNLLKATTSRR